LLCYFWETGEPLAGVLRPGSAGANTASDHFEVLQLALEQLPEQDLKREILVRADIGGRTHAFTQDCRKADIRFSVGYEVDERVREVIGALPDRAWRQATDGRAPGALGSAAGAQPAVGRGAGNGLRAIAGAAGHIEPVATEPLPASTLPRRTCRPGLPANGRRRCDSRASGLERNARAVPGNRPGAVTYLKSLIPPCGVKTVDRG
jgi:Transposase DDE domain group 1